MSANGKQNPTTRAIRRVITALIAAFAITAGAVIATASSASASTDYGVSMNQACKYTYNNYAVWADFDNYFNPFSWVCRQNTWSVPLGWSVSTIGGVDVQKYCTITYPGSRAVIVAWNAWGWRCRR